MCSKLQRTKKEAENIEMPSEMNFSLENYLYDFLGLLLSPPTSLNKKRYMNEGSKESSIFCILSWYNYN